MQSLYFDPLTPTLSLEGEGVCLTVFGRAWFRIGLMALLLLASAPLPRIDTVHAAPGGASDKS